MGLVKSNISKSIDYDVFLNLSLSASAICQRLALKISNLLSNIAETIENAKEIDKCPDSSISSDLACVSSKINNESSTCFGFLTPISRDHRTQELLASCADPPELYLLDKYRTDGRKSLDLYSFPGFFFNHLVDEMNFNVPSNKIFSDQVSTVSIADLPPPINAFTQSESDKESIFCIPLSPILPKDHDPGSENIPPVQKEQPPPPQSDRSSLLDSIKGGQFVLKPIPKEPAKRNSNTHELYGLLMRRAALEMSDSECSKSSLSDW